MATIAERIKMLRQTAGLTQAELGEVLGLVKSTISLYESGKSCPNDQIKIKICDHFGCNMDFLLGISNESECTIGHNDKGILSDGSCRSAFMDLLIIRKMSIDAVALNTGINKEILENWFINEIPTLTQLVLVADCLHTSVDYLLNRTTAADDLNAEEKELLMYYNQLPKLDKRLILGEIAKLLKNSDSNDSKTVACAK